MTWRQGKYIFVNYARYLSENCAWTFSWASRSLLMPIRCNPRSFNNGSAILLCSQRTCVRSPPVSLLARFIVLNERVRLWKLKRREFPECFPNTSKQQQQQLRETISHKTGTVFKLNVNTIPTRLKTELGLSAESAKECRGTSVWSGVWLPGIYLRWGLLGLL